MIDYYESNDTNIIDSIKYLKGEKPYVWRDHYLPHDIETRDIGSGVVRKDLFHDAGWPVTAVEKISVVDGIAATQVALSQCWFDEEKTARGVDCLWNYTREWNDRMKTFSDKPLHNWASHGADAFRMLGVTRKDYEMPKEDWFIHRHDKPRVIRAFQG